MICFPMLVYLPDETWRSVKNEQELNAALAEGYCLVADLGKKREVAKAHEEQHQTYREHMGAWESKEEKKAHEKEVPHEPKVGTQEPSKGIDEHANAAPAAVEAPAEAAPPSGKKRKGKVSA